MTGHDDFDRTLAGWFEADALPPAPAGGLDRVLDATRRRRPRPAWLAGPGSHWVGEAPPPVRASAYGRSRAWACAGRPRSSCCWSSRPSSVGRSWSEPDCSSPRRCRPFRLGHLAYGLDGDIFVADWDGRNPVRIADGAPGGSARRCGLLGRGTDVVARRAASRLSIRWVTRVGPVVIS